MAVAVVVDLPECGGARLLGAARELAGAAAVVVVVNDVVAYLAAVEAVAEVGSRLPVRVDRVVMREGAGGGSGCA